MSLANVDVFNLTFTELTVAHYHITDVCINYNDYIYAASEGGLSTFNTY